VPQVSAAYGSDQIPSGRGTSGDRGRAWGERAMKLKLCYSRRVVAYADFYEDFIRAKTNIAATGAKIVFEQIELAHGRISAILEAEGDKATIGEVLTSAYLFPDFLDGLTIVPPSSN
jgi:hypothetical protein